MQRKCLEPWIDQNARFLIVGTMPSEKSLNEQTYYANPRNKFWEYITNILNDGNKLCSIEEKKSFLKKCQIGLWDSLAFCEREGNSDSKIKAEIFNDFTPFETIKYVIFNGKKAAKYSFKYNALFLSKRNCFKLPSTSSANTSLSDKDKFEKWKETFLEILKNEND